MTEIADQEAGSTVRIAIQLESSSFDFRAFRGADSPRRADLIAERRAGLAAPQRRLIESLRSLGGMDVRRYWLVNQVVVTLPADRIQDAMALPGVVKVSRADEETTPNLAYGGVAIRDGMNLSPYIDGGVSGADGNRLDGGEIRVGVIESVTRSGVNLPARDHAGFDDWKSSTAPSRMVSVRDCTRSGSTGSCATTSGRSDDLHGTHVASVLAGSIEQGQDAAITDPFDQEQRSGVASEAEVYYYLVQNCANIATAIEEAVSDGVDIINMSLSIRGYQCETDTALDCSGVNDAIRNAHNAGVLVVASAANKYREQGTRCTMGYPGWRSEVLAVGALDTRDEDDPYACTPLADFSSMGGAPVRTLDGISARTPGVDLVAPGKINYHMTSAPDEYNTTGSIWGTSFSSPIVAGAAALLKEDFDDMDWASTDPGVLLVNLLMMGDGWDDHTGSARNGLSSSTGAGRLTMRRARHDMVGPWNWGWKTFRVYEDEVIRYTVGDSGPEPDTLTELSWAVTWFESDLTAISDVLISLYDVCPEGGGETLLAADTSFGFRKRLQLTDDDVMGGLGGRCLEMRVHALATGMDGVLIYSADLEHSEAITPPECPGDLDYCTDAVPCLHGRGDCDADNECVTGASCVENVGAEYGYESWIDVCELPNGHVNRCREGAPCSFGHGDCDSDADCAFSLHCVEDMGASFALAPWVDVCLMTSEGHARCSPTSLCHRGWGDCDTDADCAPGLHCAHDVGLNYGLRDYVDVCE
ncbi:MAG: S8 family serine peptidase [Myxococcota bacterium]